VVLAMRIWNYGLLLGCTLASALATSSAAEQPVSGALEFSRDAETVVIQFSERPHLLRDPDPGPSLRIYGDGRVEVHRPAYMQPAGDFTLTLSPEDLNALVESLVSRRLVDFDADRVRGQTRAAERTFRAAGRPLHAVFDDVVTTIEFRLEVYRPGSGPVQRDVHKKISWSTLRADARRYPQLEEIQDLAFAQRELMQLMQHPDLEPLR
jgi:hypothetical protein